MGTSYARQRGPSRLYERSRWPQGSGLPGGLLDFWQTDGGAGVSGGNLISWKGVNGATLVQGGYAAPPTFGARTLNGRPLVGFDGATTGLTVSGLVTLGNTPHTLAIVIVPRAAPGVIGGAIGFGTGGAAPGHSTSTIGDFSTWWWGGQNNAGASTLSAAAPVNGTPYIAVKVFDGVNTTAYRNGVVDIGPFADSYALDGTGIDLGVYFAATGFWQIDLGAVATYQRGLSAAEVKQLTTVLNARWAVF